MLKYAKYRARENETVKMLHFLRDLTQCLWWIWTIQIPRSLVATCEWCERMKQCDKSYYAQLMVFICKGYKDPCLSLEIITQKLWFDFRLTKIAQTVQSSWCPCGPHNHIWLYKGWWSLLSFCSCQKKLVKRKSEIGLGNFDG